MDNICIVEALKKQNQERYRKFEIDMQIRVSTGK
jgi:hypothetical protein